MTNDAGGAEMSEYKRLTTQSEVFDGATLKAFCESCGEDDCRSYCCDETETPQCDICPVQEAIERLKQYEDTGLSPEGIIKAQSAIKSALGLACELQSYRDAEKEGRLMMLPCKAGDTVYVNKKCFNDWYCFFEFKPFVRAKVVNFKYRQKEIKMNLRPLTERTANTRYHVFFSLSSIGKTVFLTREEAEAALKEV